MNSLTFFLVFVLQASRPSPIPGLPATAGAYYRQEDGAWMKLEPPVSNKSRTKGMGLFIETDGLSNLDMTTIYKGAQARIQIAAPQPVFFVRGVGSAKDAVIVQLTPKKDSRSVETSSSAATVDNKGGFKKGAIRKVLVTVYSDDSFSVIPEDELKPGEYLLAFGNSDVGFDFGVIPAKK